MKKIIFSIFVFLLPLAAIAQTGLKVGDKAPLFTAVDNYGKTVDLKTLLKQHKDVVLFFYRGQWCPFCNKHIQQLQDSLTQLTGKGAYVIGVTPETKDNIAKTVQKTKASFSIIEDKGYNIMKDYGVNFTLDDATLAKYKKFGVDLEQNNGNTDHVLPVPATYVINKSGKITFVHFDKDYRKRASVKDMVSAL